MVKTLKILTPVLLIVFFSVQLNGLKENYHKARLKALNEVSPHAFDEVVAAVEGKQPLSNERIEAYLTYAQRIARLDSERADVHGLSGFCFFFKGDHQRAMDSYLKASALAPQFFAYHYNLALIYFKTGKYDESVAEIQKGLLCDPRESLTYILSSSKIYAFMLVARVNQYGISVEDQMKNSYQEMYQLLAAVQYRLKMGTAFPEEENLTLEGF